MDNRRMFYLGCNDVSIGSSACEEHTLESVVVGFTSPTREHDFIWFAAEQPGNLHSSFIDRLSRRTASPMTAGRITIGLFEDDSHRIDNFWRKGSTGIEIQVNSWMGSSHRDIGRQLFLVRHPAIASRRCE
jgi:hypothetical protein